MVNFLYYFLGHSAQTLSWNVLFCVVGPSTWHVRLQVPKQGSNPHPLPWQVES